MNSFNFMGCKDPDLLRAKSDERIQQMELDGIFVHEIWSCSYKPSNENKLLASPKGNMLPEIHKNEMSEIEMVDAIRDQTVEGFVLC